MRPEMPLFEVTRFHSLQRPIGGDVFQYLGVLVRLRGGQQYNICSTGYSHGGSRLWIVESDNQREYLQHIGLRRLSY
jgi:hypothetical protein